MAPGRAPRRAAAATKKYTVDAFDSIKDLVVASSDSGSDTESDTALDNTKDPEVPAAIVEEAIDEGDDVVSGEDLFDTSDEERARPRSNNIEINDIVNFDALDKRGQTQKRARLVDETEIHALPAFSTEGQKPGQLGLARRGRITRGIPETFSRKGKELRVIQSIGPGEEDLVAHVKTRDKWLNDVTLPSRKTRSDGSGGLHQSFFYPEERQQKDVQQGWEWYHHQGGREFFQKYQTIDILYADQGCKDFEQPLGPSDSLLMGPPQQPNVFTGLKPGAAVNTGDAWSNASGHKDKQSWVFAAGGRIQCLEWVPNQNGCYQYLAVTVVPEHKIRTPKESYAYSEYSYGSHLQIWEFASLPTLRKESAAIDFSKKPWLRAVFSFDWGMVKRMKWCPLPTRVRQDVKDIQLGLLAGVWDDGKARILDLQIPYGTLHETEYIYISKAAFESKPPNTICTCITWLSSSSIAVGCANGYVAIWDIPHTIKQATQSPSTNPKPWFFEALHGSYILSLTSCYPSRPHILITNSMDGFIYMTDLRSPNLDTIPAQRVRVAQGPLAWHEQTQAVISPDESFDLKAMLPRVFYKNHTIGRTSALVGDLATSTLHASILAGGVDGKVWVLQPMRKMREAKNFPYEQLWFWHQWRRGLPQSVATTQEKEGTEMIDTPLVPPTATAAAAETDDTEMADAPAPATASMHRYQPFSAAMSAPLQHATPGIPTPLMTIPQPPSPAKPTSAILSAPLIRITTGLKIKKTELGPDSKANVTKEGVIFQTTYDEKTAVTQVCWNSNLSVGTWAAAGMGSGLILVEDLGV
ncbi:Serine/threonine-protein kinase [Venturia nashicola]|nr:Serine/threonine-protein kinase [Venturia nashicola]